MKRHRWLLLYTAVLFVLASEGVMAREIFMKVYREDPFSRLELGYACTICHVKGAGGGPLNALGQAFESAGKKITPELRSRFPEEFSQTATVGDDVEIVFSKAHAGIVLLKKGEDVYQLDPAHKDIRKLEPSEAQAELALAEQKEQVAVAPKPRTVPSAKDLYPLPFEFFLGNLPTTRPSRRGDLHFRGMHRFTSPTFNQSNREFDLFGLDSFAFTGIGFSYGITNRLTAGIYRSSLDRTIEFNGDFHILEEKRGGPPFSFVSRVTVEGQKDFTNFYTPNLQFVFGRSITSRAAVFFVPMISFNTDPLPRKESPHNNTVALGMGATVKVLPRLALIGEYMPRPTGFFDPFISPRPTVSFGMQFRTFRHDFELLFSNAWGTTTSRYAQGGLPTYQIGFNIYRKLRQKTE